MTRLSVIILLFFTPLWALAQRGFFVENKGQLPNQVLFHTKLNYGDFYIEKGGRFKIKVLDPKKVDDLFGHHHHHNEDHNHARHFKSFTNGNTSNKLINGHVFEVKFIEANFNNSYHSVQKESFKINIFKGKDQNKWVSNLAPLSEIILHEIYPNIDLKVYFKENAIKYDFIVKPQGLIDHIRIQYSNLNTIQFQKKSIQLHTSVGIITDEDPVSYLKNNPLKKIATYFEKIDDNTFTLKVNHHSETETLIIDPQLNFASFTGASLDNWGYTATYDEAGYAYAGGISFGGQYPTTNGAFQTFYGGGQIDMSISKFSPDGKSLEYSTYIGGNGLEAPHSMVVNSNNELVIYGITSSTNYPVSSNAYDKTFNGGNYVEASNILEFFNGTDIVITKLSKDGNAIIGSTYYGGSSNDALNDASNSSSLSFNYADDYRGEVTTDENNNIYISSVTESNDLPTPNGFQTSFGGGVQDGCIAKFNDDLSNIIWGSYFGGSGDDACYASKQNSLGETYVTGGTTSSNLSLDGLQSSFSGQTDGFLIRISKNGNNLLNGTYIGTESYDQSYFVEVDFEDKVYCFGQSMGNMPVTEGVYRNNNSKQFLQKYSEDLSSIEAATTIGTENGLINIVPSALMVSNCKEVYLAGWGGDVNFSAFNTNGMPITTDAEQKSTDGSDFYFMLLGPDFSSLKYATFFGGFGLQEHVDGGTSRFDRNGTIYQAVCAGCGGSSAFPVTPAAYSTSNNSLNCNMAVIKMDISKLTANIQFTKDSTHCENETIYLYNQSTGGKTYKWIYPDGSSSTSFDGEFNFEDTGTFSISLIAIDSTQCPYSDTADIDIDVVKIPEINIDIDTFLCNNSVLTIHTSGGPNDNNYTWWIANDTLMGNQSSLTVVVDSTTRYFVMYNNECGNYSTFVDIPVYLPPESESFLDSVCSDINSQFYFPLSPDYSISEINNEPFVLENDSIYFPENTSKDYFIRTVGFCGDEIDTFQVHHIEINSVSGPDTIICKGVRHQIQSTGGESYVWLNADDNALPSDSILTIYPQESKDYYVQIFDQGCAKIDTVSIKLYDDPFQSVNQEYKIDFFDEIEFNLNPQYSYNWSPSTYLNCSKCNSVMAKPKEDITYYYNFIDDNGCNVTDSIIVKVIFPIYVPNTFTPNGDGKNEDFGAYSQILDEYEIHIFDRWGNLAFHATSLDNRWDGKVNGNEQQEDVYVYKIKFKLRHTNQWNQKVGTVNLIR